MEMSFSPKSKSCPGVITQVTLGFGGAAVTLGGQRAPAFYTFDDPDLPMPRLALEVTQQPADGQLPRLAAFYAGCEDLKQRLLRAQELPQAQMICLTVTACDPNGENVPAQVCARQVLQAVETLQKPLIIKGCGNPQADAALFCALAPALKGKNVLFYGVKADNYRQIVPAALENGHCLCAETADDVNLAMQLNVLLREAGFPAEKTVMDIGTSAVGYGYDYVASTMDRIRLAALEQGEDLLQSPMICCVGGDVWGIKEATATQEEEPLWGSREERICQLELVSAVSDLTCGADCVILRHPDALQEADGFVKSLYQGR